MKGGAASVLVSSSAGVPGLSQNRVETSTIASVEGSSQPQAIGLSVCAFAFLHAGSFLPLAWFYGARDEMEIQPCCCRCHGYQATN